ncbi:MAG: septation protein SpoVG family protein [Candidatus Omnitrophota bacterium]
MEITEVRISLRDNEGKRLKAYATVTFDNSFVVKNIKVVDGNSGLFVAMPARKAKQFCPRCGKKVDMGSRYCNHCGVQLPLPPKDVTIGKLTTHQDLAHPINQEFRDYLQSKILEAYEQEKALGPRDSDKKETSELQN